MIQWTIRGDDDWLVIIVGISIVLSNEMRYCELLHEMSSRTPRFGGK